MDGGETEPQGSSETDWLHRARNGDAAAFERLIETHGEGIYLLCRRFTHDAHEAEDLAQEVFMRVHRAIAGFRGDAAFRTWLYRIAVNACRSWHARTRTTEALDPYLAAPASSPDELDELQREIARLPERSRLVLGLRVFSGLEFEEIADIMETTPGSVRVYLTQARKQLLAQISTRTPETE